MRQRCARPTKGNKKLMKGERKMWSVKSVSSERTGWNLGEEEGMEIVGVNGEDGGMAQVRGGGEEDRMRMGGANEEFGGSEELEWTWEDDDDDDDDDDNDDGSRKKGRKGKRRGKKGKFEEEILFDLDSGWQVSSRVQQLLGDDSKWENDAMTTAPTVRVGGIELPGDVLEMLADEAKRTEKAEMKAKTKAKPKAKKRTWKGLRVVGGSSSGARLYSSKDNDLTRPMMEKVRLALFSMLESLLCATSSTSGLSLPQSSRGLDLYAGTGSVGIEAVSRGAGSVHFVELDSWTVREVLKKNIDVVNGQDRATVHVMKVRHESLYLYIYVCTRETRDGIREWSTRATADVLTHAFMKICSRSFSHIPCLPV